jgi:hypothetical protein
MNLKQYIRKVLKEETLKDEVKKMISDDGAEKTAMLFGGTQNLVNAVYGGDIRNYFQENNLEPYRISSEPNLYIDDLIVSMLDLPETNSPRPEKLLGDFRWTSQGINYKFTARLYPMNYASGKRAWRVVGTSGDSGFGYSFITKRNTLGVRARTQIFKQIIDKYDLNSYK